jgi:antitoxin CcdA
VRQTVQEAKASAWKRENAKALESSNEWVDQHGLPLEKFRPF